MPITLSNEQYEQLVGLARQGIDTADGQRALTEFLTAIEEASDLVRYFLFVRWQEVGKIHPVNQPFPENWPPELQVKIERINAPVTRSDVERVLEQRASNPVTVMVSEDPGGELGWATLDQYFS